MSTAYQNLSVQLQNMGAYYDRINMLPTRQSPYIRHVSRRKYPMHSLSAIRKLAAIPIVFQVFFSNRYRKQTKLTNHRHISHWPFSWNLTLYILFEKGNKTVDIDLVIIKNAVDTRLIKIFLHSSFQRAVKCSDFHLSKDKSDMTSRFSENENENWNLPFLIKKKNYMLHWKSLITIISNASF